MASRFSYIIASYDTVEVFYLLGTRRMNQYKEDHPILGEIVEFLLKFFLLLLCINFTILYFYLLFALPIIHMNSKNASIFIFLFSLPLTAAIVVTVRCIYNHKHREDRLLI